MGFLTSKVIDFPFDFSTVCVHDLSITEKVFKSTSENLDIIYNVKATIWEEKMDSIKLVGCIVALIVLVAFVAPVSATPYFGYTQSGSKYSGSQISLYSALGSTTTGYFR